MADESGTTICPKGALTIATALRVLEDGRSKARSADVRVDLSGVTEADSAALALVLDWLRTSRNAGHELTLMDLPESLESLADLYGIRELLPVHQI